MFTRYLNSSVLRLILLVAMIFVYFFDRPFLQDLADLKLLSRFSPAHVLWASLLLDMLRFLIPRNKLSAACNKQFGKFYSPPEKGIDKNELTAAVARKNAGAKKVLAVWLAAAGLIGLLYFLGVLGIPGLILLTFSLYALDLFCILFWCPFQLFWMKERCCINCRVFNWGHAMVYTPLFFIKGFFSYSLIFVAFLILFRWEYAIARHPERFWDGSNMAIKCACCKDRLCRIKKPYGRKEQAARSPIPDRI